MDCYKKLRTEFNGIEKTIKSYSRHCTAANMVPALEQAINDKDKETILYCLQVIVKWYNENIDMIHLCQFQSDYEEHLRVLKLCKELIEEFGQFEFPSSVDAEQADPRNTTPIIFLSHKSDDKAYADALEKFIVGLGVKNNQLIYTSHPLHKIPMGANIYEYLRRNITRNNFMIFLWSNAYLDSPACMNEMGAAWVAQCDYTNIYVPDFSFGNPKYHQCAVDTNKMGAVLNGDAHCKQSMIELKNKICNVFGLSVDESQATFLLDEFEKEIKGIMEAQQHG